MSATDMDMWPWHHRQYAFEFCLIIHQTPSLLVQYSLQSLSGLHLTSPAAHGGVSCIVGQLLLQQGSSEV